MSQIWGGSQVSNFFWGERRGVPCCLRFLRGVPGLKFFQGGSHDSDFLEGGVPGLSKGKNF